MWIDTGGTFTDCLARDPSGEMHSAKVLSTSALRGIVEETLVSGRLRVRVKWSAPPDFIRGFRFRLLEEDSREKVQGSSPEALHDQISEVQDRGPELHIERYTGETLELAEPPPFDIPAGSAFEVSSPEEAPLLAARLVTGTPAGANLPPIAMRLATTLGTNALLERRGVPVALFLTRGFGDLLRIGTQQRPDLFALAVRKPEPLYHVVVEVTERTAADGSILEPLRLEALAERVADLVGQEVRAAAIALLHAYRNPQHERELAAWLRDNGFEHVSLSSELTPFIGILPRAETAVVDAYLGPVVGDYLARVRSALDGEPLEECPVSHLGEEAGCSLASRGALHVMTSAGGLVGVGSFRAKDGLLSGPAGGAVGAAIAGQRSGFERIIAFDMGGTSTDVARFDGEFEYLFEHQVGDAHLIAPALAIESVAAGGGSICAFEADRLRVGPESAGARPGPACYGAGGPLTLTDVNLLLGRLDPDRFDIPVSPGHAAAELERVRRALADRSGERPEREALLAGFLEIANERMADAIRRVSLRRGYDPAAYTLVAFGGAGGQHACGVAEKLGIGTVLVPPDPGLLSALGIGSAVFERFAERQVLELLDEVEPQVPPLIEELAAESARLVSEEGVPQDEVEVRRRMVALRFAGQDSALQVEYDPGIPLREAFAERYEAVFGHRPEERPIEVESIRVAASSRRAPAVEENGPRIAAKPPAAPETRRAHFADRWVEVPAYDRSKLPPAARFAGPAMVFERHSATVVEPGWDAEVDGAGALVLRRSGGQPEDERAEAAQGAARAAGSQPEAVRLELFTNRLRAIAVEMGEMLRRTALSTNVKERLDFSCALLDGEGALVVNAPHIPIHLGALGLCVRRLRDVLPLEPGDVAATNHPAFGGSHLPDVTVVTPVYGRSGRLLGYAANRAHHAEIGGIRPGSMPPLATSLADEAVVIPPMYLVRDGRARWDEIRRLLREAPHPSRAVEENLADLRSAVAANHRGAESLRALADAQGEEEVARYMEALQERAHRLLRDALRKLPERSYEALERLDDGSPLRVRLEVRGDAATIDFTGSAGVHPGNLNATPAVVRSVVTYVLRLLVNEPLPLNEGLLRAVVLSIPPGILNPEFPEDPTQAPAVGGGNVETSQRLVDTLLKALRLAACSQGTMNNVLFGTDAFGYYETVCGGCGAGPGFAGASAVHSHMTNTRITDAEVLERRYPVRLERFAVRTGSGGAGHYRGGDGAVRELTFLEPLSLSILSQHRLEGPYGLEGGEAGKSGMQRVIRASGDVLELGPIDGCEVGRGDRLILETPGGGGYGAA